MKWAGQSASAADGADAGRSANKIGAFGTLREQHCAEEFNCRSAKNLAYRFFAPGEMWDFPAES
jgi:hypothetical protein